jgi:hypothetical protein
LGRARVIGPSWQTIPGFPDEGSDLPSEGRCSGCGASLRRMSSRALLCNRGKYPVKRCALDVPFAEQVFGGGDLAAFDRSQNRQLVRAGRLRGACESVEHALPIGALRRAACQLITESLIQLEIVPDSVEFGKNTCAESRASPIRGRFNTKLGELDEPSEVDAQVRFESAEVCHADE